MFYESDVEKTIIEQLVELGYSHMDDNNSWVQDRDLASFINDEVLLERLLIINKCNILKSPLIVLNVYFCSFLYILVFIFLNNSF